MQDAQRSGKPRNVELSGDGGKKEIIIVEPNLFRYKCQVSVS
jgi:hypothetical protein